MSRTKKEPQTPKYRLHRASGQAVVTLDARDFYLGEYRSAESRAAYDRLIAEWLTNGRRCPADPNRDDRLTVVGLITAYRRHVETY